jgi:antitoxin PrlF
MLTAILTSKGRITLPLAVRMALGLTAGQKIEFLPEGDSFRVVALRTDVSLLRVPLVAKVAGCGQTLSFDKVAVRFAGMVAV